MKEEIKQTILSKLHNTSHLEEMTKPYQELAKVKFRVLADELAEEISGQFERGVIQNEHTEGSSANGLAAYRPFNLNYNVKIKITEAGHKHLEKYFGKYGMVYRKQKVDEYGFTEMQLWDVMQMFGEAIYLGCNPPFETTMYLSSQTV